MSTFAPQAASTQAHGVAELENGVTRFERALAPAMPAPGAGEFLAGWRERRKVSASSDVASRVRAALAGEGSGASANALGAPLKVLGGAACPAILVEAGYLSSQRDAARLGDDAALARTAAAIAQALTDNAG